MDRQPPLVSAREAKLLPELTVAAARGAQNGGRVWPEEADRLPSTQPTEAHTHNTQPLEYDSDKRRASPTSQQGNQDETRREMYMQSTVLLKSDGQPKKMTPQCDRSSAAYPRQPAAPPPCPAVQRTKKIPNTPRQASSQVTSPRPPPESQYSAAQNRANRAIYLSLG